MVIKLTQSLEFKVFKEHFDTEEEAADFRCHFHHAGLMQKGSTCLVEDEIYEVLSDNGKYEGAYYKVKNEDLFIPVSWGESIEKTKRPCSFKFLKTVGTVFSTKDTAVRAPELSRAVQKGYITRVARGKYIKHV